MKAMSKKCLYCYQELDTEADFHASCSARFFGNPQSPILDYKNRHLIHFSNAKLLDISAFPRNKSSKTPLFQNFLCFLVSSIENYEFLPAQVIMGGKSIRNIPLSQSVDMNEDISGNNISTTDSHK